MKIFKAEPLHRHNFPDEKVGVIDCLFIKRERQHLGFNRRMFDEDFARIFLSKNRHNGDLFKIVSNDDELVQKLLANVRTRYSSHSIDKTIRKLTEEIAQSLIFFGRAYYFLHDDSERNEFHVASFGPEGVVSLFGTHIQWIPKRRERYWEQDGQVSPREIRILDATKVMRFDMPIAIKRKLSIQNRTLTSLDKHQFEADNFQPPATYENPNPISHFDFSIWKNSQERAFYRAARSTGWDGRKYDSSKRSNFFDCHRLIRFRRNQLLLRDDILNQLSAELSKIGKGYKSKFSVTISGTDKLSSISQLNELEVKLTHEEVDFKEITDYCMGLMKP